MTLPGGSKNKRSRSQGPAMAGSFLDVTKNARVSYLRKNVRVARVMFCENTRAAINGREDIRDECCTHTRCPRTPKPQPNRTSDVNDVRRTTNRSTRITATNSLPTRLSTARKKSHLNGDAIYLFMSSIFLLPRLRAAQQQTWSTNRLEQTCATPSTARVSAQIQPRPERRQKRLFFPFPSKRLLRGQFSRSSPFRAPFHIF